MLLFKLGLLGRGEPTIEGKGVSSKVVLLILFLRLIVAWRIFLKNNFDKNNLNSMNRLGEISSKSISYVLKFDYTFNYRVIAKVCDFHR